MKIRSMRYKCLKWTAAAAWTVVAVLKGIDATAQFRSFPGVTKNSQGGGNYVPATAAAADYTTGIYVWYKPDAQTNTTANGANVTQMLDQSGNQYNSVACQSVELDWNQVNGHAVIRFTNNFASVVTMSNVFTSLTQGHLFVVIQLAADPIAGTSERLGLWGVGGFDLYPYPIDQKIYAAFGIQTQNVTVDPTPNLASTYRLYEVATYAGGAITNWLDTAVLAGSTGNTVAFTNAPTFSDAGRSFNGTVAELRIYSAPLSLANATTVRAKVKSDYGLTGY